MFGTEACGPWSYLADSWLCDLESSADQRLATLGTYACLDEACLTGS